MENVEILGDLYLFLVEDLNGTRRKMAIKENDKKISIDREKERRC
jgi:hypothetical protein